MALQAPAPIKGFGRGTGSHHNARPPGMRGRRQAARCESPAQRAVVVLPGLGNNAADYNKMRSRLQEDYGLHVEVAPVQRIDWARNAAGLVDPNYWTGTLQPRPTVDWYLQRISTAVDAAKAVAPGASITLLAHSAGGWLGRLFMLDWGTEGIDQFVSLGSPHLPPPEGVIDQTRGILTFVSQACPGVHHPDVQYITIAGRYIRGAPLLGPGSWAQRVVGAGYQQVCGDAQVWGDGVVPVPAAHLEGALQLTLDGVYHSPLGAVDEPAAVDAAAQKGSYISDSDDFEVTQRNVEAAAQEARPGPRVWYGSPHVLEAWAGVLTNPQAARELVAAAASTAAERM